MSLNYNLTKVKQLDKVDPAIQEILIWGTMIVGLTEITEKNYLEFYARIHMQELLHGTYLFKGQKKRPITLEDVKSCIGLTTNAGNFSRSEFIRRSQKRYFDDIYEYNQ